MVEEIKKIYGIFYGDGSFRMAKSSNKTNVEILHVNKLKEICYVRELTHQEQSSLHSLGLPIEDTDWILSGNEYN